MNKIHKVGAAKPDAAEAESQKELIRKVANDWHIEKTDFGAIKYTSRTNADQYFMQHDDVILAGAHASQSAETMAKVARFSGWTNVQIDGNDRFHEKAGDYLAWEAGASVDRVVATDVKTDRPESTESAKQPPSSNQMSQEEADRYERLAASVEPEEGYNDAMTYDEIRHMANLERAESMDVRAAATEVMGDPRTAADIRLKADEIREAEAARVPQFARIDDDEEPQRKVAQQANQQAIQQEQVKAESSAVEDTTTDEDRAAEVDAAEAKRRADIIRRVASHYTVNGAHYMTKGPNSVEAFHDKGKSISVKEEDEATVRDAVDLLVSRGAKSMSVSMGSTAVFKRLAWIAGQKHGIEVAGYKPTAQDIQAFQKQKPENVITDTTQAKAVQQSAQQPADKQTAAPASQVQAAAPARQPVKGELSGELLEYGEAPYQNDPKKKLSYFVTVRQADGKERTQWGVDLKKAVQESGVQEKDQITLRKTGAKDVLTTDENQEEIVGRRADWVIDSPVRERLNKEAALRAAAAQVATKFDKPEDQQSFKSGMDQRIASHNGPVPDVMIRKQVAQPRPVQREQEQLQQTV